MWLEAGYIAAAEEYAAAVGGEQAGNKIEKRGLPGAVWSNQGVQPPTSEAEVQAINGGEPAEALGEILGTQDRFAHGSVRSAVEIVAAAFFLVSRVSHSCHKPTMPLGANMTARIATTPTTKA